MGMLPTALNAQPLQSSPDTSGGASQQSDNAILKGIQDQIDAKVPPELKQSYLATIVAGMKVMFSPETSKFVVDRLKQDGPLETKIANGIADLLALLYQESGKRMSIPAAMLAAIYLMCQALDLAEKLQGVQITPDLVAKCTQATTEACLAKFGASKDKIQQLIQKT